MKRYTCLLVLGGLLEAWAASPDLRGEGPIISEILAVNNFTLRDEDGEYPDWIEVANASGSSVDMDGWYLTDRVDDLRKWRFPSVPLAPGERIVVFASGKDRAASGLELHANFQLDSQGEFLALVRPDGTVASGFAPAYPPQFADISFGIPQQSATTTLLSAGAPVAALVPADGSLSRTWTERGFNDSGWTAGTSGAGYDTGSDYTGLIGLDLQGAMQGVNGSVYLRLPFTVDDPSQLDSLTLRVKYDDGLVAYINGHQLFRRNAQILAIPAWDWTATAEHGQAISGSMAQDFDASGTAYVLTAHNNDVPPVVKTGGPAGKYLQLMPDMTGNLTNTIGFEKTFGPANQISLDFDYRMSAEAGYSGNERADGFGVALLNVDEYGTSGPGPAVAGVVWERPALPDAFSIGFDIYNGAKTENTVSLNFNGIQLAENLVTQFDLNNGQFNRVHVEVTSAESSSRVSVTITPDSLGSPGAPVVVFNDVLVPGMGPFDHRVAFGGRTGGEFTALDLDNIAVDYVYGSPQIAYEDFDVSAAIENLNAGENVLAIHGLNITPDDKDFLIVPELEAVRFGDLDLGTWSFFPTPTPGAPNTGGFPGVAASPVLSREDGAFTGSFSLAMSSPSPQAVIRYTTDGSEPTESSAEYADPFQVSSSQVIRARAFEPGLFPSQIVDRTFLRLDASAASFDASLPIVVVDTFRRGIGSSAYTPASVLFIDLAGDRCAILDTPSYSGPGGIQIRGSSSQGFPKKMYKFETWDPYGEDLDVPLLGFPKESDWVLYGPYSDKALMRNHLAYAWSNEIGRYAPRTRFVEMFLNTGGGNIDINDYVGTYVIIEKIKRGKDRVDIKELFPSMDAEPDISGGYILKKDRLDPGDSGFRTNSGQVLAFVDPKEREITAPQRAWITDYFNEFEAALYGPDFRDPVAGYAKYVDVDSFIDHHIMVEVTKNIDGYRLSTYMYKDRGKKLTMGPIWDYNLSLGNANYLEGWLPQGWYYPQLGNDAYPWYSRLFQDPDFTQRYIDRWTELRRAQFETSHLMDWIDTTASLIWESQTRNFNRWQILGTYVWPNWYIADTYQEELDFMKGWLHDRVLWIDGVFPQAPLFSQLGGAIPAGGVDLTMSARSGTIYYTLDGSDPRLAGGAVSGTAIELGTGSEKVFIAADGPAEVRTLVPSSGSLGLDWTTPAFNDSSWGGGTGGAGVGYEASSGYEAFIDWDVSAMRGSNTTVYVRLPFTATDPAAIDTLALRMMYDDGFVAYLNGRRVAQANAPDPLSWDSAATQNHDDGQSVVFQDFDLTADRDALRAGQNVLAIHGLNATISSSDLLLRAELTGGTSVVADPIEIAEPIEVIARTRNAGSWSGVSRGVFVEDVDVPLRVTEVMYRPAPAEEGSPYGSQDFEFVELQNVGTAVVDLMGVRFTNGVDFDFTRGSVRFLAPGDYVVVVEDLDAFSSRYDTSSMRVAGRYGGNLDNGGEMLTLVDGRGELIQEFTYDDAWYPDTDGGGRSLHIVDATAPAASWGSPGAWAASVDDGGSPGGPEPASPDGGWQIPGDFNQDASLDISDAVSLLGHLFLGAAMPPPCDGPSVSEGGNLELLDLNGDRKVDITDSIFLLNFLFLAGPEPRGGTGCARVPGCPDRCAP